AVDDRVRSPDGGGDVGRAPGAASSRPGAVDRQRRGAASRGEVVGDQTRGLGMSLPADRDTLLQQALDALSAMEARVRAAERSAREPIAIVGMACRTSGSCDDPQQLWTFVERGGDAVGPMPAHRRRDFEDTDDGARAAMAGEARGGFLDDVAGFDAAFFGIS